MSLLLEDTSFAPKVVGFAVVHYPDRAVVILKRLVTGNGGVDDCEARHPERDL